VATELSEIYRLIRSDERPLWNGKPVRAPFLFSNIVTIPFGLFFMGFSIFWMYMASQAGGFFWLFGMPFFLVGFFLSFGSIITNFFAYRNTVYIITDKRIIVQTGAIGLDTQFIELDKIQEVYVNTGFIDRLFGTGSIFVTTAGNIFLSGAGRSSRFRPSLAALRDPYEVYKVLQGAIQENKKERPAFNPDQP
jgi:uncharacterized membrane protein YdbT with pleckstrin-like domain